LKNILVLGFGRVGSRSFRYLRELEPDAYYYIMDKDRSKGELVKGLENTEFHEYSLESLEKVSRKVDVAVTALPSAVAIKPLETLVKKCVNIVDVSYIAEDPYVFQQATEECGSYLVADAGYAPGYSNLVAGYAQSILGDIRDLDIYVGGIPQEPVPPIGYTITWNPIDLLEEYTRPARIKLNGEISLADPLSSILSVEIPGVGVFEGFLSDGARTLLRNIRALNIREVTLRWHEHLQAMRILRDLGFLDRDIIHVGEASVKPIEFTARMLELKLSKPVNDMAIMLLEAKGVDGGVYRELAILRGTPSDPATAVFTSLIHAFTASIAIHGQVKPGVHPLEDLYGFKKEYDEYLARKGVVVVEELNNTGETTQL